MHLISIIFVSPPPNHNLTLNSFLLLDLGTFSSPFSSIQGLLFHFHKSSITMKPQNPHCTSQPQSTNLYYVGVWRQDQCRKRCIQFWVKPESLCTCEAPQKFPKYTSLSISTTLPVIMLTIVQLYNLYHLQKNFSAIQQQLIQEHKKKPND